jgi:hypothetical protein
MRAVPARVGDRVVERCPIVVQKLGAVLQLEHEGIAHRTPPGPLLSFLDLNSG